MDARGEAQRTHASLPGRAVGGCCPARRGASQAGFIGRNLDGLHRQTIQFYPVLNCILTSFPQLGYLSLASRAFGLGHLVFSQPWRCRYHCEGWGRAWSLGVGPSSTPLVYTTSPLPLLSGGLEPLGKQQANCLSSSLCSSPQASSRKTLCSDKGGSFLQLLLFTSFIEE